MQRLLEYVQHHPVLAGLAVVLALAVLVYELRTRGSEYAGLTPQEAIRLMNQGATVFDLRAPEAYAEGHIAGAKPLAANAELEKKYRERMVILCCDSGATAGGTVRRLHAAGFTKVFNLRGGLAAWRAENLPLVKS